MSMYRRIFSPLRIGGVEIPNRIVRTAHATRLAQGYVNDDLIAYHLERAKGGAGLSILESTSVHPSSTFSLSAADDGAIAPMRRLADAIAPTGMKLFTQLWHGGYTDPAADGGLPWAVGPLPGRYSVAPPIPMTTGQIGELVEAYGKAAARMQAAGLHGVEVLAGAGYLFSQFFSPVLNQRDDAYGGSFENRIRALLETLRAIRAATSPDFALGVRIGGSTDARILSTDDVNAIALRAQAEGLIDFVNITHGDYYFHVERYAGMDRPVGYQLPASDHVSQGITVPRIIVGRYATLDDAEQALKEGHAEMISIVRGMIADPMLVAKARDGRGTEVRPCISCNQGCIGGVFTGRMRCAVNAAVGDERRLAEDLIVAAAQPRKVVVVGGGVAGMEAARVARLMGHRVTLIEAASDLGGLLNTARHLPKLHLIGDIAIWLESEIYRLGVDVRLATYVEADEVLAEQPEVVIVATGSQPVDAGEFRQTADPAAALAIAPDARVLTSFELGMESRGDFGKTALVFDDVGHYEAIGCCEALIEAGAEVTYVTRHQMFAPAVEGTGRTQAALQRFYKAGNFRIVTQSALVSIERGSAQIRSLYGERTETVAAETVVLAGYRQSQNEVWAALRARVPQLHIVGDALSARDIQPAIREGHLAARSIT
ncbi:FAD-dependent oxidoreductase [Bordetella bronchiseptica]|uniref:oxidoreductase n=1 Tax=Bordetella bronchiseptica TaxID=518 RepID=UPI0005282A4A|nr:FAD-dependent oxidoreductase [Bordetella bronchiseptica]AWP78294.1 NADH-flavin oxidoreductase/NADH oxidase [Bordetella bronchiseptica]SUV72603.1 NADH:flavin oxidoreductase / NADH oxidase family protein [Bordetella bronchiseptica]VEI28892.1 NADH:flavin oxidoreductase / NADH oxidase family protein [Bordetella bronchiseptica]